MLFAKLLTGIAPGFADVRTWGDGKLRRPVPGEDRVYFTCIRK